MENTVNELHATILRIQSELDTLARQIDTLRKETSNSKAHISEQEVLGIAQRVVDLHAARRPRPSQVTITQAAEMLGISRWTVSKMVKSGDLRLNRCGMIPIEQVDAALRSA